MSEHIEWASARRIIPQWIGRDDHAPDGQTPGNDGEPGALVVGPCALTGTPKQLLDLLNAAANVVETARSDSRKKELEEFITQEIERVFKEFESAVNESVAAMLASVREQGARVVAEAFSRMGRV